MTSQLLRRFQSLNTCYRSHHHNALKLASLQQQMPVLTVNLLHKTDESKTKSVKKKYQYDPFSKSPFALSPSSNTKEYSLPGLTSNSPHKIAILDPLMNIREYVLPTINTPVTEKVSPSLTEITPKEDPTLPGNASKMAAGYLQRVRRQMHKKHKLKKRKAKQVFVMRTRNRLKAARKEAKIQAIEGKWRDKGEQFDPIALQSMQRALAVRGGYRVDVVREYRVAQRAQQRDTQAQA